MGGDILQGMVIGALSAGAAGGASGLDAFLASGLVGGMSAMMAGGEFVKGFLSAGISSGVSAGGFEGFVQAAVLGGVATAITGGKFANGAATAAFMWALRAGAQKVGQPSDSGGAGQGPERFSAEEQAAINKEIELAVDADAANKAGFESSSEAAVYLREKVQGIAENYDIEIGAFIPEVDGRYVIQDVQTSFHSGIVAGMVARKRTDWFHTHQGHSTTDYFSGSDIRFSRRGGSTGFLSNRNGLYRFRGYDYGVDRVNGVMTHQKHYFEKYNSAMDEWFPSDIIKAYY
jgi:hypothetical protein